MNNDNDNDNDDYNNDNDNDNNVSRLFSLGQLIIRRSSAARSETKQSKYSSV